MNNLQIKVTGNSSGWGPSWMAYSEELGGIDYSCEDGESWTNCGSPQGTGNSIQEAIEDFIEQIDEEILTFKWS